MAPSGGIAVYFTSLDIFGDLSININVWRMFFLKGGLAEVILLCHVSTEWFYLAVGYLRSWSFFV